ncbi:MAG: kelch repeat-containing protein [Patescibacteria group bacterium]
MSLLRHRVTLYIAVFALVLAGAMLTYLQRAGKLTLFADIPNTPGTIVVQNPTDLQKGIAAGDGKTELKDSVVKLKENTEFTAWEERAAQNPPSNDTINPGSGDFRDHPIHVSFDTERERYYVHTENMSYWFDPEAKSWEAIRRLGTSWSAWSNTKKKIISYNLTECGGGDGAGATVIQAIDPAGSGCETIGTGSILAPYDSVYFDPVTEVIVAYRQVSSTYPAFSGPTPDKQVSVFDLASGQLTHATVGTGSAAAWPPVTTGASLGYDPERKEVLLFGGATVRLTSTPALGTTLQLPTYTPTSTTWTYSTADRTWRERDAAGAPQGRMYSSTTYDQKNKRFVVFGGLTSLTYSLQSTFSMQVSASYGVSNQAWSYDPEKNSWVQIATPTRPDGRFAHGLGYDPKRHEVLAFAGMNGGQAATSIPTARNDAWILKADGYPESGTCQYDVGSPQITKFLRFQPIKTTDLPAGTKVSVQFASSIDGVTYGEFSLARELNASATEDDAILLSGLNLPENTHFLRVRCTLATTDKTKTPTFEGFRVDYQTADTSTQPTTSISLSTDKQAYALGEPIRVTIQNTGSSALTCPQTEPWPSAAFAVVPAANTNENALRTDASGPIYQQTAASEQILPGATRSWTWDQVGSSGTQVPAGAYWIGALCNGTAAETALLINAAGTNEPRTVQFSVTPTSGIAPLQVTASYTGTERNLIWDFGDGTTERAGQGPSTAPHTYTNLGVYTVKLYGDGIIGSSQVTVTAPADTPPVPVLINGSTPGSGPNLANTTPTTERPATLVSTGSNSVTTILLVIAAIAAVTTVLSRRRTTGH